MADVADAADAEEEAPKKKSKAMLFALVGAVALGGGAFFGVYSGMVPLPFGDKPRDGGEHGYADSGHDEGDHEVGELAPTAFVPLEEMIISLGPDAKSRHLRVRISIEVAPEAQESVTLVTPRIVDVLNTFLRAVDEREFEIPRAMMRMRAQMLRRVQLVTPENAVRDVLIQEFVLN